LYELVREIQLKNNKKWVGWKGEVLVDEIGSKESTFISRNFAYKPIVLKSEENVFGRFLNVKIARALSTYFFGQLLSFKDPF